jgi:hypothetical protein
VLTVSFGCASTHYDITREIGLSPPRLEEEGDFYKAAKARCEEFDKGTPNLPECIRYHETLLWAGDYKSYMSARASLNRNIVYVGGVVVLASASVLLGLATFGQTSSDAYKILPIAGTFLGGLLGFSKNDSLYEAYQLGQAKIDQAIRRAQARVATRSSPAYREAAESLRGEVGGAVDELELAKFNIVKFQAKSERDQFNDFQQAADQGAVGGVSVKEVTTEPGSLDPQAIILTLTEPPDPKKMPVEELRVKLTELTSKAGVVEILRVSRVDGAQLTVDVPESLKNHDDRTYLVQVQARHGAITLRDSRKVDLKWKKRRLLVTVSGNGTINITGVMPPSPPPSPPSPCKANQPCDLALEKGTAITLTAASQAASVAWSDGAVTPGGCGPGAQSCPITLDKDTSVTVQFK